MGERSYRAGSGASPGRALPRSADVQHGLFFKKSERLGLLDLGCQFPGHNSIYRYNDYCQEEFFVIGYNRKDVQRIHLISTGGTIEKIYSETTGSVVNLETKIDRYLKQLRLPDAEIDAISVMNIDSLEMTRQTAKRCSRSSVSASMRRSSSPTAPTPWWRPGCS